MTDKAKTLSTFILLDRSGSMATKWVETLSSLDSYVKELQKKEVAGDITVAVFDDHIGTQFEVIRQSQPISEYQSIYEHEIKPRGGTPLLDAIAKTVRLAQSRNSEKTIIVVMTDGEENSSKEVTSAHAKDLLDLCKARSWEVIFLGADFAAVREQAASLGIASNKFMNTATGYRGMAMNSMAELSACYATMDSAINIDDKLKAKAEGKI